MNILEQLAEHARERVETSKKLIPYDEMKYMALSMPDGFFEFETALSKKEIAFICECKKASPSKGVITDDYRFRRIANDYEAAGADCISVLTEPKWFHGCRDHLRIIADEVSIPVLRKDFTVDDYMIYEAKIMGAKAVLLICSILSETQLADYIKVADELGLSALVEAHDANEIKKAVRSGARIIGVNNRNLKDFTVDTNNSIELRKFIPDDVIYVAESGVKTREDILRLQDAGVNAVLIGETLMTASNRMSKLAELKGVEYNDEY